MQAALAQMGFILLHAAIAIACALLVSASVRPVLARFPLGIAATFVLPIAAATAGAYLFGGVYPAATLLISAAVGAALFANGAALFVAPRMTDQAPRVDSATAPLLLPLAIVLILAGFTIHSTAANITALLIIALVGLDVSRSESRVAREAGGFGPAIVGLVLGGAAVGLLIFNVTRIGQLGEAVRWLLEPEAYYVVLLCPGLLIPLVEYAADRAAEGDTTAAVHTTSTVAIACGGLLLPVLVMIDYALHRHEEYARIANLPGLSWRLDAPLLLVAGFAMVGVRFGLVPADRRLAAFFLILYGGYILASAGLRLG